MIRGRLQRLFVIATLIVIHLSLTAALTALVGELSRGHPDFEKCSQGVICVFAALLLLVLLPSLVLLVRRPARYMDCLASVVHRVKVLPELYLIAAMLLVAFLLFVGGSLNPLMDRRLFSVGIITLLISTAILPPMLMLHERRVRFKNRMLSFLIGLLVSLLLAEAALRILVRSSIYHPSLDLRPDIRMEIRNSVPGLSPICRHTTNSRGLRGDEPPADWEEHLTILTVGGSTTQCFNMDDRTTWSSLLQESLRVYTEHTWVGNGGLNGHTSRGHILFMTEVVPELNPDMVIILCGINDLTPSLNRSSRRRMTISSNVHAKGPGLGEFLYESSRLVQLLVRWKLILFDNADIVTSVSSHESFCETPPGFSEGPLPSDLRLILPSLPEYESNIRTIIGLGREAGVNLVFLTQPMLIEENDHWRRLAYSEATGMDYSCATVWRMMDVFNKELMQICLEENIPCFDLAGALGHDREFLFDQMHFTEAGTQEVARLVSEFMVEENLVPSPDVQN